MDIKLASVSAFVTTRIWNLNQGFDQYFDEVKQQGGRWAQERVAASVMDDLLSWFETERESTKPFFMWAHLYDPHHPHIVHPQDTRVFPIPTMPRLLI